MTKLKIIICLIVLVFIDGCALHNNQEVNETPISIETMVFCTPNSELPPSINLPKTKDSLILVDNVDYGVKINWLSDDTFRFSLTDSLVAGCFSYQYQDVQITEVGNEIQLIKGQPYIEKTCYSIPNSIFPGSISPNQDFLLLETYTENPENILPLENFYPDEKKYPQIWLYSTTENQLTKLFELPIGYITTWVPDNKQLIFSGACYGEGGNGIYSYNIETEHFLTLLPDFAMCEGSFGFMVSPDSKFLIVDGNALPLNGDKAIPICQSDERAQAQAFSSMGTFAYVFCRTKNGENTDILRRMNLTTGEVEDDLLDPDVIVKSTNFVVSPDQKWLLYEWGTSIMQSKDGHGLYLLPFKNDSSQ